MNFSSMVTTATDLFKGASASKASGAQQGALIDRIYDTEWASPSMFTIEVMGMIDPSKSTHNDQHLCGMKNASLFLPLLNASVVSVETATITHSPIEEWIGGKWVYTTGRPEMRTVTMTFRETSNAWIYRNLNTAYNANRNAYPDNQKWRLVVRIEGPNRKGERYDSRFVDDDGAVATAIDNYGYLLDTKEAILESISSMQLDTQNVDGFITFSVSFKYINPVHNVNAIEDPASTSTLTKDNPYNPETDAFGNSF